MRRIANKPITPNAIHEAVEEAIENDLDADEAVLSDELDEAVDGKFSFFLLMIFSTSISRPSSGYALIIFSIGVIAPK